MRIAAFLACRSIMTEPMGYVSLARVGTQRLAVKFPTQVPIGMYACLIAEPNDKPGEYEVLISIAGAFTDRENPLRRTISVNDRSPIHHVMGDIEINATAPTEVVISITVPVFGISSSWSVQLVGR